MAIVRTTPRETDGGSESGENKEAVPTQPLDRTKSVVNQGGISVRRPVRTPGQINRPAPQSSQVSGPGDFFRDTIAEVKRVVFPPMDQRIAGTVVTIGLLIFFALYIWGLDTLMRELFVALSILPQDAPR